MWFEFLDLAGQAFDLLRIFAEGDWFSRPLPQPDRPVTPAWIGAAVLVAAVCCAAAAILLKILW